MTRAEEQALKAYPKMSRITEPEGTLIGDGNAEKREGFVEGYNQAEKDFAIKYEKKSPITGGEMQLMQEKSSVKFRGEEISFIKKFYHCVDSDQDFTDTELDDDNMWAIFRAYWERKGFEHFYDIDGYREEQEPASPCENCEGNELPGTCASISSLGRCPLEYNKDPASEDLEKYKEFVADELLQGSKLSKNGEFTIDVVKSLIKDAVKLGAQWQKEQMMKGAVEGRLGSTVTGSEQYVSAYAGYGEYGKDGDKVKVVIIKE